MRGGSGAQQVIAMDFSMEMLKGAKEYCNDVDNIIFAQGHALNTNLDEGEIDVLLERALIHHISDLESCFHEANRILKSNGKFIIQDRTPEDCSLRGSTTHIRGYFFQKYPKLIDKEVKRRYSSEQVHSTLRETGFNLIQEITYWETRKIHEQFDQLKIDLLNRTGRSILHELTDQELEDLVEFIEQNVEKLEPIKEEDRWTIWIAEKQ